MDDNLTAPHGFADQYTSSSIYSADLHTNGISKDSGKDKPNASYRACDACRTVKLRCEPGNPAISSKCLRCQKNNSVCVFSTRRRKPRGRHKGSGSKIAELERKLASLTELLEQENPGPSTQNENPFRGPSMEGMLALQEDPLTIGQGMFSSSYAPPPVSAPTTAVPAIVAPTTAPQVLERTSFSLLGGDAPSSDVVGEGLLSMDTARQLFDGYIQNNYQNLPMVGSLGATAEEMRQSKPTLFLAMITAVAQAFIPELSQPLTARIERVLAQQIVLDGKKSMELLQSLLVSIAWYNLDNQFTQLKFYQYSQMAATMAVDIGLNKKPKHRPQAGSKSGPLGDQIPIIDPTTVEARRTLIACYLVTAGISHGFRRPNMFRFNSWIDECITFFETDPSISLLDARLAAWTRLHNIAETSGMAFGFDDPNADVDFASPQVQLAVNAFASQLEDWERRLRPGIMNGSVLITLHAVQIYIHEVALHSTYDTDDFSPPFTVSRSQPAHTDSGVTTPSMPLTDALIRCATSAQAAIDVFCALNPAELRTQPMPTFIRITYSLVLLLKLHFAVREGSPVTAGVLDVQSLAAESYLNRLVEQFQHMAMGPSRPITGMAKYRVVIEKVREWFHGVEGDEEVDVGRLFQPMVYLNSASSTLASSSSPSVRVPDESHGGSPAISEATPRPPLDSTSISLLGHPRTRGAAASTQTGTMPFGFGGMDLTLAEALRLDPAALWMGFGSD